MDLEGKVVLITGASRGIGRATALLFAEKGAKVVVNYNNSKEKAEQVVSEIVSKGGEAVAIQADVSVEEDIKRLFADVRDTFGNLDILVNNAAIYKPETLKESTAAGWERTFSINAIGPALCCREAALMMEGRQGRIINLASVSGLGHMGSPGSMAYAASKAAVEQMTKTMAKDISPNILVNAVAPGPVDTDLAKAWSAEKVKQKEEQMHIKKLLKAEDIAEIIVFAASSDVLSGSVLLVDGGISLPGS